MLSQTHLYLQKPLLVLKNIVLKFALDKIYFFYTFRTVLYEIKDNLNIFGSSLTDSIKKMPGSIYRKKSKILCNIIL